MSPLPEELGELTPHAPNWRRVDADARERGRHAVTVAPAVVLVATRPRDNPAHLPHAWLAMRRAHTYIWVRYRLPLAMAQTLTRVADAIATLRAAGHTVTRTSKRDAALRYGCQTCLYVVDGRGVNVGRLRQLALEAKTADAADAIAARTAPHASPHIRSIRA